MPNNYPASRPAQSPRIPSHREMQVAVLATLSNADIALTLGISPHTVKNHITSVMRKNPELETRAAVAVWADRLQREAA